MSHNQNRARAMLRKAGYSDAQCYADGGRTRPAKAGGKTTINIVLPSGNQGPQAGLGGLGAPMPAPAPMPAAAPPQQPPMVNPMPTGPGGPPMAGGPMPGGPMPMAPGGAPMGIMKNGGRAYANGGKVKVPKMTAGAGSGLGRLQQAKRGNRGC